MCNADGSPDRWFELAHNGASAQLPFVVRQHYADEHDDYDDEYADDDDDYDDYDDILAGDDVRPKERIFCSEVMSLILSYKWNRP